MKFRFRLVIVVSVLSLGIVMYWVNKALDQEQTGDFESENYVYRLENETNYVKVASEEKVIVETEEAQASGSADIELGFEKVSLFENYEMGYRLAYPSGFEIKPAAGKIELTPPSGEGQVAVYKTEEGVEVDVVGEQIEEQQMAMLEKAASLVRGSYELIEFDVSPDTAAERFR